jgi:hypothetical protein
MVSLLCTLEWMDTAAVNVSVPYHCQLQQCMSTVQLPVHVSAVACGLHTLVPSLHRDDRFDVYSHQQLQ